MIQRIQFWETNCPWKEVTTTTLKGISEIKVICILLDFFFFFHGPSIRSVSYQMRFGQPAVQRQRNWLTWCYVSCPCMNDWVNIVGPTLSIISGYYFTQKNKNENIIFGNFVRESAPLFLVSWNLAQQHKMLCKSWTFQGKREGKGPPCNHIKTIFYHIKPFLVTSLCQIVKD